MTEEEDRETVRESRDGVRKVKAHLESNMVTDMKGNKKSFSKFISRKRKTRENTGLVLNEAGGLVTKDMEKVKVVNAFFPWVFTVRLDLSNPRPLRPEGKSRAEKTCPQCRRTGLGST